VRFISKFRREDHVGSTSETVRRLSAMVKKFCYSSRRGSSHGTNIPEISGKFNLHGESGDMTSDGARKSGNKAHGLASRLAIGLILLAGGLTPANAQTGTGSPGTPQTGGGMMGGGHGGRHRNQQQNGQPAPALAPLPVVKEPWPRLDSGAILCKSRDDLLRYQTGSGAASTGPAPDCHVIRQRTAIQILDRDGPSRAHVVTTDDAKQTGWTNAYLSSEPPPSATTPTAVKH
jgi:hypothetical protein